MYIDTIRICGHEQPMGMALDPLTISWKVRDAVGKNAAQESLVVAMDPGMQDVVWEKSGADLPVSLATISETAPDLRLQHGHLHPDPAALLHGRGIRL